MWSNGTWSFTGPTEWTPLGLNHTWFYPGYTQGQVGHLCWEQLMPTFRSCLQGPCS